MKFSELPLDVQNELTKAQRELKNKNHNGPFEILFYNEAGTRYFRARRFQKCWYDDKGHYLPFGGGSSWSIRYGKTQIRHYKSCCGTDEFTFGEGQMFAKSANGTLIPSTVQTKKEVVEIARKIGIFNI